MAELTINRRQAVRAAAGAAAGGVLVAGAGVGSAEARADNGKALIGSWLVTHRNDPPADPEEGTSVVSFIAGGVVIDNEINPAGPVGTGVWEARSNDRFRATFWNGNAETDNEDATVVRIRVAGQLRNKKVSGVYTVTVYDTDGKRLQAVNGTFSGTRLAL